MENLNEMGLLEMAPNQLEEIDGGLWWIPVAIYILVEWDDITQGIKDGAAGKEYNYEK